MDTEEFTNHVQGINNAAFCSLLLSTGHELGLFDLIIKHNRPLTSHELATIAGMKERYVREWLSGAAVAKFISVDPETMTFSIPTEHHAALREAASNAIGVKAYSARTKDLHKCFMKDGPYGFTYDRDAYLWQWWGGWRAQEELVKGTLVPYFKQVGVQDKLDSGVDVIDLCCGSGEVTVELAKLYPKSSFTGAEYFEIPFNRAKECVASSGLANVSVVQENVHDLPDDMKSNFDVVVMFDSLHDLPDPLKALTQVSKVLKSDGNFIIQDYSPSANIKDNIGNLAIGTAHADSIYCCLPSSMSDEPHIGYGTCWGRQNILSALQAHFNVNQTFELSPVTTIDFCTKKVD